MVFCRKKQKNCQSEELLTGDCWIGLSLATDSGLILAARVGKHTDDFLKELVVSTQGKTDCTDWNTDGWGGYERVLPPEIAHCIGKENTQRCSCELTELLGNRRVAGIVARTNLLRFGNRRELQHGWLSAISTGFGFIVARKQRLHKGLA